MYFRYDHAERLTAREAQMHHYFSPIRDNEMNVVHSELKASNNT